MTNQRVTANGFRPDATGFQVPSKHLIIGGTLFGVGRFLRALRWDHFEASIDDNLDITSSPKYKLRGHQIGYPPLDRCQQPGAADGDAGYADGTADAEQRAADDQVL